MCGEDMREMRDEGREMRDEEVMTIAGNRQQATRRSQQSLMQKKKG
jgi:hypothetical protein